MASSLDVYYPFDAGAGSSITEDQWRAMARQWIASGPIANEDNGMLPYGDSSGMQVKVKTGKCFMRGHYGEITAEKTLPISSVAGIPGGQSRLDRVVLRNDFVNNVIEVDVLTGTPAATGSQVAPAVTQSTTIWEVSLGTVGPLTSATVTIAAGTVTDGRTQIAAPRTMTFTSAVVKSADESVSSATTGATLQNDDELLLALLANTEYVFDCFLYVVSGATPDFKMAFTVPSGASLTWEATHEDGTTITPSGVQTGSGTSKLFGTAVDNVIRVMGTVRMGATAGSLQLQWAQNTSSAGATTVKAGSSIRAQSAA